MNDILEAGKLLKEHIKILRSVRNKHNIKYRMEVIADMSSRSEIEVAYFLITLSILSRQTKSNISVIV